MELGTVNSKINLGINHLEWISNNNKDSLKISILVMEIKIMKILLDKIKLKKITKITTSCINRNKTLREGLVPQVKNRNHNQLIIAYHNTIKNSREHFQIKLNSQLLFLHFKWTYFKKEVCKIIKCE